MIKRPYEIIKRLNKHNKTFFKNYIVISSGNIMLHKEKNYIILSTRRYINNIVVRGNVIMERSVHNIICTSSYLLSLFSMNAITLSSLNLKTIR